MYYILPEGLKIESNEPVYCTVYTVYSIQCILYIVHCTLYIANIHVYTHLHLNIHLHRVTNTYIDMLQ